MDNKKRYVEVSIEIGKKGMSNNATYDEVLEVNEHELACDILRNWHLSIMLTTLKELSDHDR